MTRARRAALIVGALVAAQLVAILVYRRVERGRVARAPFDATALPGSPAPALAVERPDGTPHEVAGPGPVRLVHFWATWCEPCRIELPALLARAAATPGLQLVAVSVDTDWDVIRRFFPRGTPAAVVRARASDAHHRYGAQALPDSYVIAADGRLVERIAGARDWTRADAAAYLRGLPARWSAP